MVCGWEGDVCLSVAHGQKVTSPSVTWFEHGRLEESENVGNVPSVNAFFNPFLSHSCTQTHSPPS